MIRSRSLHPGGIMKLDIYLNYRGNCEEAFRFYERHLGGKVTGIVHHSSMPNPAHPPGWGEKVMHARLEIGSTILMGADVPNSEPMRSAYLTLTVERDEEADRIYGLLTEGGQIFMAMQSMNFASRFAMFRDRFGTSWMLLCQPEAT